MIVDANLKNVIQYERGTSDIVPELTAIPYPRAMTET
jgi:hypothetical protein